MIHHAMNKPPATPRGRRPGAHDTRSDIVAAARRAFAARGLDGTSIRAVAREAGYRSKVAVSSIDLKVDCVGACVGVRGSRIKNIVDELGGEKIDIVRWNESSQILIQNALKPAEVAEVSLCFELGRATVVVNEDQLSLAIGKRGQNVRLAARLTGWDVDILTPVEFQNGVQRLDATLKGVEGFPHDQVDKVIALGLIDVRDIEEVGAGPLMEELQIPD
jgi:N utilization substance protein A